MANLKEAEYGPERVHVLTQNLDSLLEAAGCSEVVHLHGRAGFLHCTLCGRVFESPVDPSAACPQCRSVDRVKPFVVMFGESAPNYRYLEEWKKKIKPFDVVLVIGTKGEVLDLSRFQIPYARAHYFLDVKDADHSHEVPADSARYGLECCTEFLPKIRGEIARLMSPAPDGACSSSHRDDERREGAASSP